MPVVGLALAAALSIGAASCASQSRDETGSSSPAHSSLRMPDGKEWLTQNLSLDIADSYCFDDREANCRRYGRLYTWQSAQQACRLLGDRWRLPTDDDWRELAGHYGGAFDGAEGSGKAAYQALLTGGRSGFDAVLGGGRALDEVPVVRFRFNRNRTTGTGYDDLDGHGFYWTATDIDAASAPFYNFGRGSLTLYRQPEGEKARAFAVRCLR
jgi:uncharacterized protein (TIGR02145 family)